MWSRLVYVTALDRNEKALLLLLEHGADSGVDHCTWGSVHACTRQCGCQAAPLLRRLEPESESESTIGGSEVYSHRKSRKMG
jgi:hypothetical protein